MIQMISNNIYVSLKLVSLYYGLRLILVFTLIHRKREADLKFTYALWGIVESLIMSLFSWQCRHDD